MRLLRFPHLGLLLALLAPGIAPAVAQSPVLAANPALGTPVAAEARAAAGTVLYLYDDGDGDTNQGPPSTFDPDMLWGNYFLTQPGGEVITEISVAFGPTFPSLEDGPVTFWLLDDPDMDLDPRNATALVSVEATPDVFNDNFFTVEIPPTRVSGAFFVGASALLQGGEDRPARVDRNAPGDRSWFCYAPDIAAVIDDLASAPYCSRMDGPDVVLPGAFMVRATGEAGEVEPPVAAVSPEHVTIEVTAGESATRTLTLSNAAAAGAADLTFAASVLRPDSVVVDFEDGENPYAFTLGIPAADEIEEAGGNPGRWFRNAALDTFVPALHIGNALGSPFTGDFVARGVRALRLDAQTVSVGLGIEGRPFTLRLIRFNGEPNNPEAHDYVYYAGELAPQPGQGWHSYVFEVPSDFTGELPEGWSGGYYGDPETLPPGVVWQDILREVDKVEVMWGHPAFFYIPQGFDIGVDNVGIAFAGAADEAVTVEPAEGAVAAGAGVELEVTVDAAALEIGTHGFEVAIATNDPANPVLTVGVTVEVVMGESAEGGALPTAFALGQNYPNPFAARTAIEYALPTPSPVRIAVYDAVGRLVATLVDAERPAGYHSVEWNANGAAAGVYFYRIEAGPFRSTQRMVLVR